jgi:ClpP class serine protease
LNNPAAEARRRNRLAKSCGVTMAKKKVRPKNASEPEAPAIVRIQEEMRQGHSTRRALFEELEKKLRRPVVTFFTSFDHPVMLEDDDADMLQSLLETIDLSRGLALMISSPGGDGLAAERIISLCRNYSGKGEYWVLVPGKAKSAATLVCFGADKILMGPNAELGPVDPQIVVSENGVRKAFALHNVVKSYEDLFDRAVASQGHLEPFMQQLANYDAREIQEFKAAIELSGDISVQALKTGMMKRFSEENIRKKIESFLTPTRTKSHGRPIFRAEAQRCGLKVQDVPRDTDLWRLISTLYVRTRNLVTTPSVAKCIENKNSSFTASAGLAGR